jgi:hypothetical protein
MLEFMKLSGSDPVSAPLGKFCFGEVSGPGNLNTSSRMFLNILLSNN